MQSPSIRPMVIVPDAEKTMSFGEAMAAVLNQAKVTRLAWKDRAEYLYLRGGVLHLHKADGSEHVLSVSDGDLAGEDWIRI
jgi:hypothetical protein